MSVRPASVAIALGCFAFLLLAGCRNVPRIRCDAACWPRPRIGPTCRALCREPQLEGLCPDAGRPPHPLSRPTALAP